MFDADHLILSYDGKRGGRGRCLATESRAVPVTVQVLYGKGAFGANNVEFDLVAIDEPALHINDKAMFYMPHSAANNPASPSTATGGTNTMQKFNILRRILENPIVGIVRAADPESAHRLAGACVAGGITSLEVSLTTPDGLDVIRNLNKCHYESVAIGAGTVLDTETARMAILAGASFILSPSFDQHVIQTCNRYQVVSMPGVATATEVVKAMEAGADIIKVFPGDVFGPAYLKALRAPLPHAPLMPSGGVTLENMEAWFANGAVAVGVGGSLTGPGAAGDYEKVTENAKAFVQELNRIRAASA